ncbi:MAG: InlB B-repeat-containing protein [Oscillospiraceae bacterium]|nr:InlB B-repeat-containing protein [Oscillospiraceae bacterium]
MLRNKLTKILCVLLIVVLLSGMIGGTGMVTNDSAYQPLPTMFNGVPVIDIIDPVDPANFTQLGIDLVDSNQVTVIFQGNGHTGGQVPGNLVVTTPDTFTFPDARNTLFRAGYDLVGWRHAMEGGRLFALGAVYAFGPERTGIFTLNAEWVRRPIENPPSTVMIRFHAGSGRFPVAGNPQYLYFEKTPGALIESLPPNPVRAGHNFGRWYTTQVGGSPIIPGETRVPNGNWTFWASWIPAAPADVTLMLNWNFPRGGAPGEMVVPRSVVLRDNYYRELSEMLIYNLRSIEDPNIPRRVFPRPIGWFTASEGGTRVTPTTFFTEDTEIFIRWTDPQRHWGGWYPDRSPAWYPNVRITLNLSAVKGHDWYDYILRGTRNWHNDSRNPVSILPNPNSRNNVIIYEKVPVDDLGGEYMAWLSTINAVETRLEPFNIYFNESMMDSSFNRTYIGRPDATIARQVESVMAHEIGHAVGLADGVYLGGRSNASLMNSGRNRMVVRGPQEFDNEGVRWIYN